MDNVKQEEEQDVSSRLNDAIKRAEKAEAACAEMRNLLKRYNHLPECNKRRNYSDGKSGPCDCGRNHALSTDCGKGWLSPSEAKRLQAACAEMRDCLREIKVRIAYIGMPQEPFWLIDGRNKVWDWRKQTALLEHALHSNEVGKGFLSPERKNHIVSELRWIANAYNDNLSSIENSGRMYDASCVAKTLLAALEESHE